MPFPVALIDRLRHLHVPVEHLGLADFEDPELYDKLSRARREAAARPLSLVRGTLELGRGILSVLATAALLPLTGVLADSFGLGACQKVYIHPARNTDTVTVLFIE